MLLTSLFGLITFGTHPYLSQSRDYSSDIPDAIYSAKFCAGSMTMGLVTFKLPSLTSV